MLPDFINKLYPAHKVLASPNIKSCWIFLSNVSQYHQTTRGRDYLLYCFSPSDVILSDMFQSFQNLGCFVQDVHLDGRLRGVGLLFQCGTLCVAVQQILAYVAIKVWGEVSTRTSITYPCWKSSACVSGDLEGIW